MKETKPQICPFRAVEASSAVWSLIRGWGSLTHSCLVPSLFKYTFSYDFLSTLMEIPGLSFLNTGLQVTLWILDYRGRWKVHLLEKPLGRKEPYLTKRHGYCVSWSHRGRLQRNASWLKGEMWGREWKEKELAFMFLEKSSRVLKTLKLAPKLLQPLWILVWDIFLNPFFLCPGDSPCFEIVFFPKSCFIQHILGSY